MFKQFLEI
jgi:hypothetical protein